MIDPRENSGNPRFARIGLLWISTVVTVAATFPACTADEKNDPWTRAEVIGQPAGATIPEGGVAPARQARFAAASTGRDRTACRPGSVVPNIIRIGLPELLVVANQAAPRPDPLLALAEYLKSATGYKVEFVRISAYADFTRGILDGTIHAALFPPGEYLRARSFDPCLDVVATTMYGTSTSYTTHLIVRRDSQIVVPSDLAGKRIAFSTRSSASGYIFATRFLADRGLMPDRDYVPVFTGGHQHTIRAVELGTVDAGATFGRALNVEMQLGRDLGDIAILAVAGQIPNEPLVFASTLAQPIVESLSRAFLGLNRGTPDGRRLLGSLEMMSGWVPSDEHVYDQLMDAVRAVDQIVRLADSSEEVDQ